MKSSCVLFLLGILLPTDARRVGVRRSHVNRSVGALVGDAVGVQTGDSAGTGATGLKATLDALIGDMIESKGPGVGALAKLVHSKMDIADAVRQLDGKLPAEVASLVKLTGASAGASNTPPLSEQSMQKARRILNGMVVTAWAELDDVVIECKEFQARNRGTYGQVVSDLASLSSQLSHLYKEKIEASEGATEQDRQRRDTELNLENARNDFFLTRLENSKKMTIRRNNLAVFDFILNATQCRDGQSFLQQTVSPVQVCNTPEGLELNFNDPKLQAQVEQMMTPEAKLALREALGQVSGSSLLELQVATTTGGATTVQTTTTGQPTLAAAVMPVQETPAGGSQWKKCANGTPNCGLLHDLMSLEWGKFRDSFDELTADMKHNKDTFESLQANLNDQMVVLSDGKTKHSQALGASISSIASAQSESTSKELQKRTLTSEYDSKRAECQARISEILFTRICAVKKVRNELLENSQQTPPSSLSDCEVSDWVSKTGECFSEVGFPITCDDSCPQADVYKCGGYEVLKRDMIGIPNANGIPCPHLERNVKCGQKKCPVACEMSTWSGWSQCSSECGGGQQSKTRSIIRKPSNGGKMCDTVVELRNCNSGSCDRNCALEAWSEWTPCSMACGGGMTTRTRDVLVPIRGMGKCPRKQSTSRSAETQCNRNACVGDEVCIAQQDLIILLDASGSLREDGFKTLQSLAMNLTERFKGFYFGIPAMHVGLVLFGNGHLVTAADGSTSVSSALIVQGLTGNMDLLRSKISEQTWQRGFTNMAQAFAAAEVALMNGGRSGAQSAVLVLSDGKYSFKYQTEQKAQQLKDKNVQIYMAPVTEFKGQELKSLKKWASQPWETNYERIPGLGVLKYNTVSYAGLLLTKFCPDSMSPSSLKQVEEMRQYILIHEDGLPDEQCGPNYLRVGKFNTVDECAQAARERSVVAFSFGKGREVGVCTTESVTCSQEDYGLWHANQTNIACPGGEWKFNPFFDSYAINPATMSSTSATIQ